KLERSVPGITGILYCCQRESAGYRLHDLLETLQYNRSDIGDSDRLNFSVSAGIAQPERNESGSRRRNFSGRPDLSIDESGSVICAAWFHRRMGWNDAIERKRPQEIF